MLNANVKSQEGISRTSFSILRFKNSVFLFHLLPRFLAIFNDSKSLSIPIKDHSSGK